MVPAQVLGRVLTLGSVTALVLLLGCRQVTTRQSGSPTPLPGYESGPTMPGVPTSNEPPLLTPGPTQTVIPPVPPSTARLNRTDSFGFTGPKLPEDVLPSLEIPASDSEIQPTRSDEVEEDEVEQSADIELPPSMPVLFPIATKERPAAPVELDPSLFLVELFEDAALEAPTEKSVPTTINGMTIRPLNPEPQIVTGPREPSPWPADGILPTLTITPGPVMPKWTGEPTPTRSAEARPRRLMWENSDSAIRPIE